MRSVLPLLLCVAVPAAGVAPGACASDIVAASAAIAQAGAEIADAVKDCASSGKTPQCVSDIGSTVSALGSASADISKAVGDCGSAKTGCSTALSQVVAALGSATSAAGRASKSCAGGDDPAGCAADILATVSAVASAGSSVATAVKECGSGSHVPIFNEARMLRAHRHGTCCAVCGEGLVRHFSVDGSNGFCSEACLEQAAAALHADVFRKVVGGLGCAAQKHPDGRVFANHVKTTAGLRGQRVDLYLPIESAQ